MSLKSRVCGAIATLGPIGSLPMPGTFGTIAAVPLLFLFRNLALKLGLVGQPELILTALFFIIVWVVQAAMSNFVQHDPSEIVLDEVLGYFVTMLFFPLQPLPLLLGFGLFRFFDIVKPLGIDQIERLDGAWGIVLDDVVAGIFAHICARMIFQYILI